MLLTVISQTNAKIRRRVIGGGLMTKLFPDRTLARASDPSLRRGQLGDYLR